MWNHVGLYIFAANNRYMKQIILIFVATLFLLHANAATPDDSLAIRMAYDNLCQGDTESAMAILAEASGRQHIQRPHRNSDNTFLLLGMTGMTAIAALSFFAWKKGRVDTDNSSSMSKPNPVKICQIHFKQDPLS